MPVGKILQTDKGVHHKVRFDVQKQWLRSGAPWHFEMPGRFYFLSFHLSNRLAIADFVKRSNLGNFCLHIAC